MSRETAQCAGRLSDPELRSALSIDLFNSLDFQISLNFLGIGYLHLWNLWSQSEHFLEFSDFLFSISLLRGFLGLHVSRRSENGRIDFRNFLIQNISRCSYLVNQFLFSQSTESLDSETFRFFSQIDDFPVIHFNIESKNDEKS